MKDLLAEILADLRYYWSHLPSYWEKYSSRVFFVLFILFLIFGVINFAPFINKQVSYDREDQPEFLAQDELEALPADWISIPSIDVGTPVVYVNEKNEFVFQTALQNGVVHYPETALPGELGNMYVFGHSSDIVWASGDYKTVFALLPKMQIGDKIYVTDSQATVFEYEVVDLFVVNPSDTTVLDQFNEEEAYLTLQTSYPLGTALKRFIVRAQLVEA